ncbi:MAG TPA: SsrA-binding protein SmpB [Acidimicrobiia bacterium]|nr:SsrA-binding protein SmpB [Acidimicrobiia bacterium]
MARSAQTERVKVVASNRRARRNYTVVETLEAGLALLGSEVKSLREGRLDLKDSYVSIKGGEAFLVGAYVAPYEFARDGGHEPERERKLLLHRREIDRIAGQIAEKGLTVVPLQVYFKDGKAKVELGLAKGKTSYDKRETLKERDADREVERAMARARKPRA